MQSEKFHDFDEFSTSVHGVESRMLLRNPKRRFWSVSAVALGEIDVQWGRLGSGNIAQGQLRPDRFIFYAPLSSEARYTVNGSILQENSFAILEPGCEFCVSTEIEHDWFTALIPSHMLSQVGADSLSRSTRVSDSNALVANRFRTVLEQIFSAAATCAAFKSSLAAHRAAVELVRVCAEIAGDQRPIESHYGGRPRYSRQEIIRRSMELIESNRSQRMNWPDVNDLSANANVSERTLRTSFKEFFDVGPNEYLQLRRLHEVYNALRTAKPDEFAVSQILLEHGEWAFGRFAARYKVLFGELPSETLLRPPKY